MKAVINLDVPEWQIGSPVKVYFKDTMEKSGVCEAAQEPIKPVLDEMWPRIYLCGNCGFYVGFEDHDDYDPNEYDNFCRKCGKPVLWEGR